jgi:hypothetical protein
MNKPDDDLQELCRQITEMTVANPTSARAVFFKLPLERQQSVANRLPAQIRRQLFAAGDASSKRGWGFPADPIL